VAQQISLLKEQIRNASDAELREMLLTFKQELFNLRLQEATNQLGNPKRIRFVRKAIARILTVQRERELAAAQARAEGGQGK
jgi:large subunit ribosomal protein L29